MDSQDTFTALSTPHGESALGVIRCSGPICKDLVKNIFGNKSPTPRLCNIAKYKDKSGQNLDQVVYTYFELDRSYTGDPMLEISCHGNPFILQKVLEDLVNRGCRYAQPGEFTQTAFLNGKMDLSQAEAVIDLIKARTRLAHKAASDQLQGSLSRRINELVENVLQVLAEIEAYIDFPEEDLPTEGNHSPLNSLKGLSKEVKSLSDTAETGIFLREGVKAIIIGEPNAGKSSLLNCLLGESRVIVSEKPGTTRDYVEASFFVDPYRINIIDTAGVHETQDEIEIQGIHKTLEQIDLSDLILLTIDSSKPPPTFPDDVVAKLKQQKTLVIFNKVDLAPNPSLHGFLEGYPKVKVSALNGSGINQLKTAIGGLLGTPIVSEKGDVVAVSARHHSSLQKALLGFNAACSMLGSKEPAELVACHLREALTGLEEIIGKIDNERMLDKLFSSFCIGK
ncbi:MAG: tRNA uridine-5-carboxymethylaminomethyl(34) synthesis GTPase MnmE [Verrucomicrobiae bacterium]|nr:tRNA uridine-5-carboxymethylaminomethyl(34) synthesis GTPase MnmE [Verrucomicrobiae bacterium]